MSIAWRSLNIKMHLRIHIYIWTSWIHPAKELPTLKAVEKVGKQNDGTWVLGPDVHNAAYGTLIDSNQSKYMWVGHFHSGAFNHCTPPTPSGTSESHNEPKLLPCTYGVWELRNGDARSSHTQEVPVLPHTNCLWTVRHRKDHSYLMWFGNSWCPSFSVLLESVIRKV